MPVMQGPPPRGHPDEFTPEADVTDLVNALARPVLVWRNARAILAQDRNLFSPGQREGARKRMRQAEADIRVVVRKWES